MSHIATLPVWGMVFWGVITFSILVFMHEGGHFLTARMFGIKVHEFMLGLPGPALKWRSKKSGTKFGVTAIPLGGYVRIAGMEPGSEDELLAPALKASVLAGRIDSTRLAEELHIPIERASSLLVTLADYMALEPAEDDDVSYVSQVTTSPDESAEQLLDRVRATTYRGKKTWQRIVILAAGVAINIIAAILTFSLVLGVWGTPVPSLRISQVVAGSAAERAGMKAGDRLVAIDGVKLKSWEDMTVRLRKAKPGQTIELAYSSRLHNGETQTRHVALGDNAGRAFLGVQADTDYQHMSPLAAIWESLALTGAVFVAIMQFFGNIIHFGSFLASLKDARSVVGISQMAVEAVKAGPLDYAWFVALLSLSLGAMNILPLPPLDGGKVLMELIEKLSGHPIKREVSLAISATGTLLLFSLIAYLMYADFARIATGG